MIYHSYSLRKGSGKMNNWVDGIQNAIAYIEDNLTEKLEIKDIASKAYVSEFHFQRIFSALCGFTVSEYIRNRRLTLAAEELSLSVIPMVRPTVPMADADS